MNMQIYQAHTSIFQGKGAAGEKNTGQQKGFEQELGAALGKHYKSPESGGKEKVSLGRISSGQPTVSHLMAGHRDYADECWDIIHSESNHNKPYTRIPEGTEIFLNPETKEITWEDGGKRPESTGKISEVTDYKNPMEAIKESISAAASKYNLPERLIEGVVRAESGFDIFAVSRAGARGLMQIMPGTADELGVSDSFDIRENIDAGARYLKQMLHDFGGSLEKALAAYNAGPGTVRRYAGDVPYPETRQYVERVLSFL
ncbi:MAG: lytic transglycosylase domain-containing protein [Desulfosalsimonas sp.]